MKQELLNQINEKKKELHKIEMDLVYLLEENKLTKEDIINHFTNLINEVRK